MVNKRFKKLRRFLGLDTIEERVQDYLALEAQEAVEKANRDQLAISYAEHTRTLNLCKSETDEFVVSKIQDKYDAFFEGYKQDLTKAKESYDKLKTKREKLLNDEELSKAVKLHKAYEKFDSGEISLEIYDKIIKAVTKNKVKYADMIIFNNESKFLILQRAKGDQNGEKWVIPGGHVDPGESFDDAAKRELLEESGLKVSKCEKVGEFINDDVHIEYHETHVEDESVITLDDKETHDYKWIYIHELKDYEMVFDMKENLEKIYKPWKKAVVKLTKAFLSGLITNKEVFDETVSLVIEKAKYTPQQQTKMEKVMGEFKDGTLKHGSTGKVVTDRKMAIAIALSEAGISKSEDDVEKGGLSEGHTIESVAKKHDVKLEDLKKEYDKGKIVEKEHTDSATGAAKIALDHLVEDPKYYTKLATIEKSEETEELETIHVVIDGKLEKQQIVKARSGKYADTAENRKLNRVGQPYGSSKKEEPAKDEKSAKKDDTSKEQKPQDLGSAAQEASEAALIAASKGKDKEHREVAHAELQRREKEEKPQEDRKESENSDQKDKKSNVSERKYDSGVTSLTIGENLGSRIVGYLDKSGKVFQIKSTFVKEEERGQGLAKKMYKQLIEEVKSRGVEKIKSDQQVEELAGKIYESLEKDGFVVDKVKGAKLEDDPNGNFWWVPSDDTKSPFEINLVKEKSV